MPALPSRSMTRKTAKAAPMCSHQPYTVTTITVSPPCTHTLPVINLVGLKFPVLYSLSLLQAKSRPYLRQTQPKPTYSASPRIPLLQPQYRPHPFRSPRSQQQHPQPSLFTFEKRSPTSTPHPRQRSRRRLPRHSIQKGSSRRLGPYVAL